MIDLKNLTMDGQRYFDQREVEELEELLSPYPDNSPSVEQVWQIMDEVWDQLGCDNINLNWDKISAFYSHPVWILNGLFIEQHDLSMQHRQAIANWIEQHRSKIKQVVDYGGGMGTLAKLIADLNSNLKIDICEPYPSQVAIKRLADYQSIQFVDKLKKNKYDCLVSTDVLEHVVDPLDVFAQMVKSVKIGGYLIVANCFGPEIKCHLPTTFHLRYTFKLFTYLMGIKSLGKCQGSHATIYLKEKEQTFDWKKIRQLETFSKLVYPSLNSLHHGYRSLKKITS